MSELLCYYNSMGKKEFETKKLIKVNSNKFIYFGNKEKGNEDIITYMYILGKIWNDMSLLMWEYKKLSEYREPKNPDEYGTPHFGVYHGIKNQFDIRLISFLNEINIFFKKAETINISNKIRGKYITNRFLKMTSLDNLKKISIKNFLEKGDILPSNIEGNFANIRSNIGFHYHSNYNIFNKIKDSFKSVDDVYYNKLTGPNNIDNNRIYYSDLIDFYYAKPLLEDVNLNDVLLRIQVPIGFVLEILNKEILGE